MSKKLRKTNGRKGKKGSKGFEAVNTKFIVGTATQNIVPDEMDVCLEYPQIGVIFAAAQTSAKRWTPNAPYDVDPTLGSTSTPGFSEWAAFYSYVRVEKYSVDVTVVNIDTSPLDVYFIHSNTDPGTVGTNYQQYATAAFGTQKGISPKGGMDRIQYRRTVSVSSLVGAVDVSTDDSFRSLTSATPTDLVYFGIGAQTMAGGNMVSGINFSMQIKMWCKFYGRKNNLTTRVDSAFEAQRDKWKLMSEEDRRVYLLDFAKKRAEKALSQDAVHVSYTKEFSPELYFAPCQYPPTILEDNTVEHEKMVNFHRPKIDPELAAKFAEHVKELEKWELSKPKFPST